MTISVTITFLLIIIVIIAIALVVTNKLSVADLLKILLLALIAYLVAP